VKFLLTDSVGFVWGVFDHRTFEAHYTEVLINNMEERTADVVEFFRVWVRSSNISSIVNHE